MLVLRHTNLNKSSINAFLLLDINYNDIYLRISTAVMKHHNLQFGEERVY